MRSRKNLAAVVVALLLTAWPAVGGEKSAPIETELSANALPKASVARAMSVLKSRDKEVIVGKSYAVIAPPADKNVDKAVLTLKNQSRSRQIEVVLTFFNGAGEVVEQKIPRFTAISTFHSAMFAVNEELPVAYNCADTWVVVEWTAGPGLNITVPFAMVTEVKVAERGKVRAAARFLPDDQVLLSFRVGEFLESKTFAELRRKSPQSAEQIEVALETHLGVAGNNLQHITMGLSQSANEISRPMIVVTTTKPVTWSDIKDRLGDKNGSWNTANVLEQTIHILGNDGNPAVGRLPICVATDRIVLAGTQKALTKLLERKGPTLTAGMRSGLKEAGPGRNNLLTIVFDVQRMLAEIEENKLPGGAPIAMDEIKGLQQVVITVNETDKISASATFICKDAAGANRIMQMFNMVLPQAKNAAGNIDNLPANEREKARAICSLMNAVELKTTDNRVVATLTAEPAVVASLLQAIFAPPAR